MYSVYANLRDKMGLSDFAFAKKAGVSRSTISDWKNGLHTPNMKNLKKIADCLGIPVDDLVISDDAQSVIDRVSTEIIATSAPEGRDEYYFNLYRKDREFWDAIRILYFLPRERRKIMLEQIRDQGRHSEKEKDRQTSESSMAV